MKAKIKRKVVVVQHPNPNYDRVKDKDRNKHVYEVISLANCLQPAIGETQTAAQIDFLIGGGTQVEIRSK